MQSRRDQNHGTVSPSSRLPRQQRFGSEQGSMGNPRTLPEVSPRRKIDGSGRLVFLEGKGGPSERREHGWHLGSSRREKVRQGSPRQFLEHERTYIEKPRKHGYVEYEYENPRSSRARSIYMNEHHGAVSRVNNEDYQSGMHGERGIHGEHGIREQKSLHMEDGMTNRPHMVTRQMGATSSYGDDDAPVPWASRSREFRQFENENPCCPETRHEKSCYQEFIEHEELQFRDAFEQKRFHYQVNDEHERLCYRDFVEHDQLRFRDASEHERFHHQEPSEELNPSHRYSIEHTKFRYQEPAHFEKLSYRTTGDHQKFHNEVPVPTSYSKNKNIAGITRDDDFPCSSSGVLRCEYTGSIEEGEVLPASHDYPRSSVELTGADGNNRDQRTNLRDIRTSKRPIRSDRNSNRRSVGFKYDENLDFESGEHACDDDVYPSEYISRQVLPPCAQIGYKHVRGDHEHDESFRSVVMHPTEHRIDRDGVSSLNMRASTNQMHHNSLQEAALESLDDRGMYSLKRKGEPPCPECCQMEGVFKGPLDSPTSFSGVTEDRQHFRSRLGYGFGRGAGPQYSKDRLHDMAMRDNFEFRRAAKRQRMEEIAMDNLPDTILNSSYSMKEDFVQHDTRPKFSRDSIMMRECEDPYDNEWIDEYVDEPESGRHNRSYSRYSKGRMHDEPDQPRDSSSDVRFKSCDSSYQRRNQEKYYKLGVNHMNSQHKLSWWNKSYETKGSSLHRQPKVIQSSNSYIENTGADNDGASKGFAPEPSEESEEFKQLVNEAFLTYSKDLNLHPGLQKRYREQGKAGSLFCIVCGRRLSKDFLDTQRLVTHAYMSHKVGLRTKHLGLHKAICVLMGWNTYVPCDTVTWVPEVLPESEALAQKEDLILWPPLVIIHNISMSNNNPEGQKVIPIETVASFLRGKGFVEGKMKVVLGKPADQSIILLKFLGTFTGLSSAEKIHKYFSDNNRGKIEFRRALSSTSSSSSSSIDAEAQGDKIMEQLLYGYLGIADDLDRLDSHTKQWISVKSKKEIQELADEPVKKSNV